MAVDFSKVSKSRRSIKGLSVGRTVVGQVEDELRQASLSIDIVLQCLGKRRIPQWLRKALAQGFASPIRQQRNENAMLKSKSVTPERFKYNNAHGINDRNVPGVVREAEVALDNVLQ